MGLRDQAQRAAEIERVKQEGRLRAAAAQEAATRRAQDLARVEAEAAKVAAAEAARRALESRKGRRK